MITTNLIVLIYKRKILLKRLETKTIMRNHNYWSFLESISHNAQEAEKSILKKVTQETNLSLPFATLALKQKDALVNNHFYLAQLTDKNVNEITRHEGEELLFFSMEEADALSLSPSSRNLFLLCNEHIRETFDPVRKFSESLILNT